MPGVHRLQHVKRFTASDFPHDDPVRPHAQSVGHEIARCDAPQAFDIRRPRFHAHDMLLVEDQFRCIFNRHNPFLVGYRLGDRAEKRRFARTCSSRDEDVFAAADHPLHQLAHLGRKHA